MAKKSVYVYTDNATNEKVKFFNWNECQLYMKENKGTVKGFKTEEEADSFIANKVKVEVTKIVKKEKEKKTFYYGFKAVIPEHHNIFDTWDEVLSYQNKYKGEGKKFKTKEEAEEYINEGDPLYYKDANNYPKDAFNFYVDGSFSETLSNYSYGLACEKDGKVIYVDKGQGTNEEAVSMRQIGGELLGAIKSMLYASKNDMKKIVIFFDYKGVCYHALGYWKPKNDFSKVYYEWCQEFFKKNPDIEVYFCKVDAHTGDDFNEIADSLAKSALNIPIEEKLKTLCKSYGVEI